MRTLAITAAMMDAHGDVIRAWLEGADVQVKENKKGARWQILNPACSAPNFFPAFEYRISPYSFKDYARLKTVIDAYESGDVFEVLMNSGKWRLLKDPVWDLEQIRYRMSEYTYTQWTKHGETITAYLNGAIIEVKTASGWSWQKPTFALDCEYRVSPWTREQLEAHRDVIRAWERGELIEFKHEGGNWQDWTFDQLDKDTRPMFSPEVAYRVKPSVYSDLPKWAEVFTCRCGKHTLNVDPAGHCYLNGTKPARDGEFEAADGTIYVIASNGRICEIKKRAPYHKPKNNYPDPNVHGESIASLTDKISHAKTKSEREMYAAIRDAMANGIDEVGTSEYYNWLSRVTGILFGTKETVESLTEKIAATGDIDELMELAAHRKYLKTNRSHHVKTFAESPGAAKAEQDVPDEELVAITGIKQPEPNDGVLLYVTSSGEVYIIHNQNSPQDLEYIKSRMALEFKSGEDSDKVLLDAFLRLCDNNFTAGVRVQKLHDIVKTPAELDTVYRRVTGKNSPGTTLLSREPVRVPITARTFEVGDKQYAIQDLPLDELKKLVKAAASLVFRYEADRKYKVLAPRQIFKETARIGQRNIFDFDAEQLKEFLAQLDHYLLKYNIC